MIRWRFQGYRWKRALTSLHEGTLEISLTVPLSFIITIFILSIYLSIYLVRGLKTSLILGEEHGRGFGAWDQKHKVNYHYILSIYLFIYLLILIILISLLVEVLWTYVFNGTMLDREIKTRGATSSQSCASYFT